MTSIKYCPTSATNTGGAHSQKGNRTMDRVAQAQPVKEVKVIYDGRVYRWHKCWQGTSSTEGFLGWEEAREAAASIAFCYGAHLLDQKEGAH
jgi:hypothetical protein